MLPVLFTRNRVPSLYAEGGWDPFRGMLDAFTQDWPAAARGFAVDVREEANQYVIEADLPGVGKDDLELSFEGKVLTISAKHGSQREDKGEGYYVRERRNGTVSRQFRLPDEVDRNRVEAELKHGVLTVTLAKSEAAKPKRIEVSGD